MGKALYIDRSSTFTSVPGAYLGLDYLRTANDDKNGTEVPLVTFDVDHAITVYSVLDVAAKTPRSG